jgi:hypothetical protein
MRVLFAVCALLLASACTTSRAMQTTLTAAPTPAGSTILIIQPDVELGLLTAGGVVEPRADWAQSARDNLLASFQTYVTSQEHTQRTLDPTTAMDGRVGQVLRLHDAVGNSILIHKFGALALPNKDNRQFDWTLGDGVQELAAGQEGANYAVFVTVRGSYASSGRVAAMVFAAALGASIPLGGQQMFASVVDLRTGDILWFNVVTAGPGDDIRTPEGAAKLVTALMGKSPL